MPSFGTISMSILASCIGLVMGNTCPSAESLPLTQPYYPPNADCWEYKVPVTITSENVVFDFPDWQDDYALQDFLTNVTTRPSAGFPGPIVGTKNETATYTLAASFCTPKGENKKKTVILATHGIGQARTHWNSAYLPEEYNFVQHAISNGYSVWFYDRLGTGESEKISGFKNQLRIQKAILVELTKIVKSAGKAGSYGILDPGYLTWVDAIAQINTYFKYPFYDIPVTSYAEEYKEPFAIGEFLTIADGDFDASGFTGAALAITGEIDYIICDGECKGIFDEPARTIWRNAKFTPYLHPHSSHNLNFHHNATGAYGVITDFLASSGL
ncbi:Fc.00g004090.m01.CDS01 [Cosmosporella sp. VM-42]